MKTRQKLLSLLLVLLLVVCMAPAAFAELTFSGDQESISGEYDSTVFLAGESPNSSAKVKGILFEAGMTVSSAGSSEYAFMAGNTVTLTGSNSSDAFLGGNAVSLTGDCGRDLAVAGNTVEIRGSVGRDLLAYGRSVVISGHVGGDALISAEQITVTNDAVIEGKLRYNSSANINAPADLLARADVYQDNRDADEDIPAIIETSPAISQTSPAASQSSPEGTENTPAGSENTPAATENTLSGAENKPENVSPAKPAAKEETKKTSPIVSKLKSAVFRFIGVLLIAYFCLWLTPLWERVDADYTGKPFGKYAKAFGIGLAVLAALPLACIILMVSGIGVRPAFVLLFVVIAAMIAAPMFLGFFLGSLLWRKALKKKQNYWAELAIGLALWTILIALPGISFFVKLVAACLGLGVLTLLLGKKKKNAAPEVPAPVPPVTDANLSTPAAEPVAPILPPQDAPPALEPSNETAK